MGINGIINKISADADTQIAQLEAENKKAMQKIKEEALKNVAEIEKSAQIRATEEQQRAFDQTLSREEAKLRVEFLRVKQELVVETFAKARNSLLGLPNEELKKRYLNHIVSFGEKNGKIIVGSEDKALLDEDFVKSAGDAVGGSFDRELSDSFKHGFMLIAGKIQYDARFDELYNEISESKTDQIASILFSGEAE
ncbi:hypothetical protein KAH81_00380 [bacterium]|nr:hypothetical protein [bacterium]